MCNLLDISVLHSSVGRTSPGLVVLQRQPEQDLIKGGDRGYREKPILISVEIGYTEPQANQRYGSSQWEDKPHTVTPPSLKIHLTSSSEPLSLYHLYKNLPTWQGTDCLVVDIVLTHPHYS